MSDTEPGPQPDKILKGSGVESGGEILGKILWGKNVPKGII